jgi:hypothetical protein
VVILGRYFKFNAKTGEYDIPCSWRESLKLKARNTWIPYWKRKETLDIADTLTEEEAERLCKELDKEIQRSIEEWRTLYQ